LLSNADNNYHNIDTYIGILEEKNFFFGASSEGLTAVLGSQVWENFFVHLYCNKCLRLASENFVLAIE